MPGLLVTAPVLLRLLFGKPIAQSKATANESPESDSASLDKMKKQ
jgi:hypothetical protein